jgi:hypothetical protein
MSATQLRPVLVTHPVLATLPPHATLGLAKFLKLVEVLGPGTEVAVTVSSDEVVFSSSDGDLKVSLKVRNDA